MGSVSINCQVSLSKKLRALLKGGEGCSLVLTADVKDGKGVGRLSLTSGLNDDVYADITDLGETSIQLTPVSYSDETPNNDSMPQAAIFSTIPSKGERSPVVNKIAAVHPPERGEEAHAVVPKERIKTPEAFKTSQEAECKGWISNMEELMDAVNVAKNKKSEIDPTMAQNDREKAVLMELKEKDEAIDVQAWIVNDKAGILTINDLDITLPLNSPYDLGNISARRIMMSRDLKGLLKSGYVRFISPSERGAYISNIKGDVAAIGLEVFDHHEEAEANMTSAVSSSRMPIIDDRRAMDITEEDMGSPTDEESMIMNLTQDMPVKKFSSAYSAPTPTSRHSTHGQASGGKTPTVKPIRKV